jgi:hypothetical protein
MIGFFCEPLYLPLFSCSLAIVQAEQLADHVAGVLFVKKNVAEFITVT